MEEEKVNSFKLLLEEDERLFRERHEARHQDELHGSISMFRLIGDLFHLFLPQMMDSAALSAEADSHPSEHDPASEARPPSAGPSRTGGPGGPDPGSGPATR